VIQWVHLGVQVRSEEDFNLLTTLLGALGVERRGVEDYKTYRVESFLPPVAALEVFQRKTADENAFIELTISDPDTVYEIVERMGLQIVNDHSGAEPTHFSRSFGVRFPSGFTVNFTGLRTGRNGGTFDSAVTQGNLAAKGLKFAIVVSRFNSFIVERLLSSALDCLYRLGVEKDGSILKQRESIAIVRVPGAFEIPSAARTLAETGKYDAVVCLGCLLRGDTAHYDVIVNEVARGIGQSAQETGVPHAFGVLTCETLEQAIDRAGLKMGNKGFEAALAAVEMANLKKAVVGSRSSVVREAAISPQPSAIRKNKGKAKIKSTARTTYSKKRKS
jgi:6,7-dimethyl-8-ribityllumazine synthase